MVLAEEPDVVLLDARLEEIDAASTCRRIYDWSPETKIVTVTGADDERAHETIVSGSLAAIPLLSTAADTAAAIRCVADGGSILMSRTATRLLHDMDVWSHRSTDPLYPPPSLTSTEREIIGSLGDGVTTEEIAERYEVTPHLVHLHIGFAITKLHRFALGWGKVAQRV